MKKKNNILNNKSSSTQTAPSGQVEPLVMPILPVQEAQSVARNISSKIKNYDFNEDIAQEILMFFWQTQTPYNIQKAYRVGWGFIGENYNVEEFLL